MTNKKDSKTDNKKSRLSARKSVDSESRPALHKLLDAFQTRFHRIIEVIDDALNSEQLRDRIWAVEQMLKRLKTDMISANPEKPKTDPKVLEAMSDVELVNRIRELLDDDSHSSKH